MSVKYFCDSCGEEKKSVNDFEIPCHLFGTQYVDAGYSDGEGNSISGRKVGIDLCNKCLNVAYTAAVAAIRTDNFKALEDKITKRKFY